MRYHEDERRKFWGDIFGTNGGDINIVRPTPNVFIGWHRHQRQDDRLFVVQGILRLRLFEEKPFDGREWLLGDQGDRLPVVIPRNWWHGYMALTPDTIVLQFNGPGKWDGTDEERMREDEMPWKPKEGPWTPTR